MNNFEAELPDSPENLSASPEQRRASQELELAILDTFEKFPEEISDVMQITEYIALDTEEGDRLIISRPHPENNPSKGGYVKRANMQFISADMRQKPSQERVDIDYNIDEEGLARKRIVDKKQRPEEPMGPGHQASGELWAEAGNRIVSHAADLSESLNLEKETGLNELLANASEIDELTEKLRTSQPLERNQ
jgi:hypothetical protein